MEMETQVSQETEVSTPSTQTSSERGRAPADNDGARQQLSPDQHLSVRERIEKLQKQGRQQGEPSREAAPQTVGDASVDSPEAAPSESAEPAVQKYQPNFKFKVSNQEREMDEWIRSLISDEATEKKARELFEKAYGLDVIKPRMIEERNTRKQLETQFSQLASRVAPVEQALAKGDLETAFRKMNLTDEKVFQYAWNRLQYLEQPQEYRNSLEAQKSAQAQVESLQSQIEGLNQQRMTDAVHSRTADLNTVLEKPEIKAVADHFDARTGIPGSFKNEVIKRGQLAYYTAQKDLTAQEAVSEVLSLLGNTVPTPGAPQAAPVVTPAQATQAQAPAAREKPPVIPVVQGKPQSPVSRAIRSTEDLKRIRKEKFGS